MSTPTAHRPDRGLSLRARRILISATGVVLLGGAAIYATVASAADETAPAHAAPPPAPRVTVAPVEQKLVTDFEEFTGRVDARETVELRARVSGHLESVEFQAGQLVKKGDVLFRIDPRWYQAQFDLAKARADVAAREAKRAEQLLTSAAISSEEAESRRAAAAEAQAELESARLDLDYTNVRAPIDGRISRAYVTSGNLVSGSPGNATLLTTIVSVGEAYVYADIDEASVLKFNRLQREGRIVTEHGRVPVELQLDDESDFPRHGFIESADNRIDPSTGSLALRLVFPNSDGALIPGLFARVRIPLGAPQPTLLVSERAIGTDQSQKFVLAVGEDHVAAYRTVQLGGTAASGMRVVRTGLKPGEQVIVNGLQRVRPGMTVDPQVEVASTAASANTVASR